MCKSALYSFLANPVYYLYDYYSSSVFQKNEISSFDINIRESVWNFKSGIETSAVHEFYLNIVSMLTSVPGINTGSYALLLLPASSEARTNKRYGKLIAMIKRALPNLHIINDHIVFTGEKNIKHSSAERNVKSCSHFVCTGNIPEQNIIVFDDVITRGHTLRDAAEWLSQFGPKNISYLCLARTVMKYARVAWTGIYPRLNISE